MQNAKVAMNMPSDSWVPRSRMKVRSSRGPSWPAASDSATMVIENTVAAIEIIEPAIVASSDLAPSTPRPKSQTTPSTSDALASRCWRSIQADWSSRIISWASKIPRVVIKIGQNQRLERVDSAKARSRLSMKQCRPTWWCSVPGLAENRWRSR
jgi:hypothetical protein